MKRNKKLSNHGDGEVDMTPMLDIVFILLIFFIVTTSFVKEMGIEIDKPKAQQANDINNKPSIVIQVSEDGLIRFNNKLVDIERVPSRIENFLANNDTNTVVLLPEKEVTYDFVVAVMDQIKSFPELKIAIK